MGENEAKRNTLFTCLVYIMLKAPQELVQIDKTILKNIFALS